MTVGILLWFGAFLTIGGEWFLMWESKIWNGQDAAARVFLIEAVVLILLAIPARNSGAPGEVIDLS